VLWKLFEILALRGRLRRKIVLLSANTAPAAIFADSNEEK